MIDKSQFTVIKVGTSVRKSSERGNTCHFDQSLFACSYIATVFVWLITLVPRYVSCILNIVHAFVGWLCSGAMHHVSSCQQVVGQTAFLTKAIVSVSSSDICTHMFLRVKRSLMNDVALYLSRGEIG